MVGRRQCDGQQSKNDGGGKMVGRRQCGRPVSTNGTMAAMTPSPHSSLIVEPRHRKRRERLPGDDQTSGKGDDATRRDAGGGRVGFEGLVVARAAAAVERGFLRERDPTHALQNDHVIQ